MHKMQIKRRNNSCDLIQIKISSAFEKDTIFSLFGVKFEIPTEIQKRANSQNNVLRFSGFSFYLFIYFVLPKNDACQAEV